MGHRKRPGQQRPHRRRSPALAAGSSIALMPGRPALAGERRTTLRGGHRWARGTRWTAQVLSDPSGGSAGGPSLLELLPDRLEVHRGHLAHEVRIGCRYVVDPFNLCSCGGTFLETQHPVEDSLIGLKPGEAVLRRLLYHALAEFADSLHGLIGILRPPRLSHVLPFPPFTLV